MNKNYSKNKKNTFGSRKNKRDKKSFSVLEMAFKTALQDLRACYEEHGIIAGRHHFTDYWARDGFFAAMGSLAAGDWDIAEKMVKLFLSHQRADGLIPYRIMRGPITIGKYLGRPKFYKNPQPTYRLRGFGPLVLDGTTLTLTVLAQLGQRGRPVAARSTAAVRRALRFLESRERYGLLWDGVLAEWNDSAYKWGTLLYSNIIYWKMFEELKKYYQQRDNPFWKEVAQKQTSVAEALRRRLWNGRYFADWYDYKRHDYLYPYGNCLAIAWGFTTPQETAVILKEVNTVKIKFTLDTNTPKYPWWRIEIFNHLLGMGDYQNHSLLWWQPSTAYLEALLAAGKTNEANRHAQTIAQQILSVGIYECYERKGEPVRRLAYRSEGPFAWAAGGIVQALIRQGVGGV